MYGLRIGTTLVDAGVALELEARDVLAVADRADHGHLLAADWVGAAPTDSIRSMTAWISSSVAVGFITIIICQSFSLAI